MKSILFKLPIFCVFFALNLAHAGYGYQCEGKFGDTIEIREGIALWERSEIQSGGMAVLYLSDTGNKVAASINKRDQGDIERQYEINDKKNTVSRRSILTIYGNDQNAPGVHSGKWNTSREMLDEKSSGALKVVYYECTIKLW